MLQMVGERLLIFQRNILPSFKSWTRITLCQHHTNVKLLLPRGCVATARTNGPQYTVVDLPTPATSSVSHPITNRQPSWATNKRRSTEASSSGPVGSGSYWDGWRGAASILFCSCKWAKLNRVEVQEVIRGLKVGKAPSPNCLPNRALKHLPHWAICLLVALFNAALLAQYSPRVW
jgi:hypothetical protein